MEKPHFRAFCCFFKANFEKLINIEHCSGIKMVYFSCLHSIGKITFWWNKIILSHGLKHHVINQGRGSPGFLSVCALVWGGGPDKVGFGGGCLRKGG